MDLLVCQANQRRCQQRGDTRRRRLPRWIDTTRLCSAPRVRHASAFTLIELLIVIAIIALIISILVPALSRSREVARRTICASNLRQFGIAMLNYAQDFESWLPCKGKPGNPTAKPAELVPEQPRPTSEYGPNFAGIVRDVIERRHTRGTAGVDGQAAPPQYLPDPKIMLCPSDRLNNPPGDIPNSPAWLPDGDLWPTQAVLRFEDLPRTARAEATAGKSYISYIYIALWRNDDRGDFLLMADQSNHNDTSTFSFTSLQPEDNHGTRGMNVLLLDSHVEWSPSASGNFADLQVLSNRYWGPINVTRARYPDPVLNPENRRAVEVRTVE